MSTSNKFYRSADDQWIGGVCGGIGRYTNTDPLIWRLLFLFLGFSVILYILVWLLTDEQ